MPGFFFLDFLGARLVVLTSAVRKFFAALVWCVYTVYTPYAQLCFMQAPFQLSQADGRPMYLQIMDNIKQLILKGQWLEGQALPSIRELAVSIKVSVITVKRAYQELEREGVIGTRQGLGSFVAEQNQNVVNLKQSELMVCVDQVIDLADLLRIDEAALLKLIARRIKEGRA